MQRIRNILEILHFDDPVTVRIPAEIVGYRIKFIPDRKFRLRQQTLHGGRLAFQHSTEIIEIIIRRIPRSIHDQFAYGGAFNAFAVVQRPDRDILFTAPLIRRNKRKFLSEIFGHTLICAAFIGIPARIGRLHGRNDHNHDINQYDHTHRKKKPADCSKTTVLLVLLLFHHHHLGIIALLQSILYLWIFHHDHDAFVNFVCRQFTAWIEQPFFAVYKKTGAGKKPAPDFHKNYFFLDFFAFAGLVLTFSLSAAPTLNLTAVEAAILIFSPFAGL